MLSKPHKTSSCVHYTFILIILVIAIVTSTTSCNVDGITQTNESLTIYAHLQLLRDQGLSEVIAKYQELYPNVNVIVTDLSDMKLKERNEKTANDIMTGSGPDIIFNGAGGSLYKQIKAGAFADMTPFIENDPDFDIELYYDAVIDYGKYQDKQYIMPLSFYFPILLTSKETLDKTNIDLENSTNYLEILKQVNVYLDENPQSDATVFKMRTNTYSMPLLFSSDLINYETASVNLLSDEFRRACELYKPLWNNRFMGYQFLDTYELLKNDKIVFDVSAEYNTTPHNAAYIKLNGGEPIIFPLYTADGKIQAIPYYTVGINNASQNQQNAYNFIKLMISPIWQNQIINSAVSVPILKTSVLDIIDQMKYGRVSDSTEHSILLASRNPSKDYCEYLNKYTLEYLKLLDSITECKTDVWAMETISKSLTPYFKGDTPLDECLTQAQDMLEIYMSE